MTRRPPAFLAFGLCLTLGALPGGCGQAPGGSGGGIGGSGLVASADGVSLGAISAFGSVVLNGERFATDASEIVIAGEASDQSRLRVGMVVRADVDFATMSARRVEYEPTLIGPVESVRTIGSRTLALRALGQDVLVNRAVASRGLAPGGLHLGLVIEASGARDPNGTIVATFLREAPGAMVYRTSGPVGVAAPGAGTFAIGALSVDATAAQGSLAGTAMPTAGTAVSVSGPAARYDADASSFAAARLDAALEPNAAAGESVQLEGFVSAFDSVANFEVNGQGITTRPGTLYAGPGGVAADPETLGLGSRVEIEGSVDGAGRVDASVVIVVPDGDSELDGTIESIDVARSGLTIFGIDVALSPRTRIEDEDDPGRPLRGVDQLAVGSRIEVHGAFRDGVLLAESIELGAPGSDASLTGPVTSLDVLAGTVEVLGAPIALGPGTSYEINDRMDTDRDTFLRALVPGAPVDVSWREFSSLASPADRLEMEVTAEN